MTTDISANAEPLPGYRLLEHLGTGGYGEVWSVEAPGGLTKALKFVFGRQNEKRAVREMRALEMVRSLRHPFLLSLERIEIIDGRLLIVTELADESVRDRFDAYREQGQPGIPRDELLRYLRDAADALDFLSNQHALQHLDVKPENLLLVAGHVKVADFGLVKDMRQSEASLVGGMTPMYSAPEVFRGAPSTYSDQYSLAILYQEMLTGTLPFGGANAAELTLQHMNDEPDLAGLSSNDRYVISRALAKEPDHRYPTCLSLVEALLRCDPAETAPQPMGDVAPARTITRGATQTEIFDDEGAGHGDAAGDSMLLDYPESTEPVVDLPPLDVSAEEFRPTPTLVLGIGGTAGQVLKKLRQRMHDELGSDVALPAVQMLLLDTNPRAVSEVTRTSGCGLRPEETLTLPLRRPQHYRNESERLLRWLSRRWLYNIPRSMHTEGLRPLGRLALVDHARQACQRIRHAVAQAVEPESVAASTQALGKPLREDAVRVYVVSSVSGGTGSGMSLDVGYIVQTVFEKLGITDARVTGVIMHSTGRQPQHTELAQVNAYSWLTEYRHFCRPDVAYPGDASCGLPAHDPDRSPYDDTYFVHLGNGLETGEFHDTMQMVADYLMLDVLSPAQMFLDACRREGREADDSNERLRTFGLHRRDAASNEFCDELAAALCRRVFESWQGETCPAPKAMAAGPADDAQPQPDGGRGTELVVHGSGDLIRRLRFDPAGIATNMRIMLEAQLASDGQTFLQKWLFKQPDGESDPASAVDRIFDGPLTAGDKQQHMLLGQPLEAIVEPLVEKLRGDLRQWVNARLDDPQERLAGAREANDWMLQHAKALQAGLGRLRNNATGKLTELRQAIATALTGGEEAGTTPAKEDVWNYFRTRLDISAVLAAEHLCRQIMSDAKVTGDQLVALGRELKQMADNAAGDWSADNENPSASIAALRSRVSELAATVDQQLQTGWLGPNGGMLSIVMGGGRPRAQLGSKLQEFARQAVRDALKHVNVLADRSDGSDESSPDDPLRASLTSATPLLLSFGGRRRVLAMVPDSAAERLSADKLAEIIGTELTVLPSSQNSFTLCVEAEQLSVPHVAVELVQRRRDRAEFAERVHTRTDIRWTPMFASPDDTPTQQEQVALAFGVEQEEQMRQTEMLS